MKRILLLACIGFVATMGLNSTSYAGWHSFWERAKLDWHRNQAWPQPFIARDRLASCSPFVTMAQNGWALQSTLTSDHFDRKTQMLTEAGTLKVRDIVTQHPAAFRTIYIVVGPTPEATEIRTDSVQQSATQVALDGPLPEVRHVNIEPRGRAAKEVRLITEGFESSAPVPRLPK